MRGLAILGAGLALMGAPAGQAATIISTGTYGASDGPFAMGSVDLGPGIYRFQLDVSSRLSSLEGGVTKQVSYNEFCDYQDGSGVFYCSGNETPQTSDFVKTAPLRYVADMTVASPSSVAEDEFPFVRIDNYDVCCTYVFAGLTDTGGRYTFSYSAAPEPQGWALLIVGFGAIGAALRRRAIAGDLLTLPVRA